MDEFEIGDKIVHLESLLDGNFIIWVVTKKDEKGMTCAMSGAAKWTYMPADIISNYISLDEAIDIYPEYFL